MSLASGLQALDPSVHVDWAPGPRGSLCPVTVTPPGHSLGGLSGRPPGPAGMAPGAAWCSGSWGHSLPQGAAPLPALLGHPGRTFLRRSSEASALWAPPQVPAP